MPWDRDRRRESGVERMAPQGRPPHLQDRGDVLYPNPGSCVSCGRTAPGPLSSDALAYICRPIERVIEEQREHVCMACWLMLVMAKIPVRR